MSAARSCDDLPPELQDLSFFADLSAFTMQQRRQLATITKPLNNHHIPYRWPYPAKLLVTKDGNSFVVATIKEGLRLMKEWQILEPKNMSENMQQSPPSSRVNSDAETGWNPDPPLMLLRTPLMALENATVFEFTLYFPPSYSGCFLHRFQRNRLFLHLRLFLFLVFPERSSSHRIYANNLQQKIIQVYRVPSCRLQPPSFSETRSNHQPPGNRKLHRSKSPQHHCT